MEEKLVGNHLPSKLPSLMGNHLPRLVDNHLPRLVDCDEMRGLKNENSSCYMDSALFALYAIPNSSIEGDTLFKPLTAKFTSCKKNPQKDMEFRQKIQKEIQTIVSSMRHGDNNRVTAKKLRDLFDKCDRYKIFNNDDVNQDVQEFIMTLLILFECNTGSHTITTYLTNNLEPNVGEIGQHELVEGRNYIELSPVWMIASHQLDSFKTNDLQSLLTVIEDSGELSVGNEYKHNISGTIYSFKRRIEVRKLMDSKWLVIWVDRTYQKDGTSHYNSAIVQPNAQLTIPGDGRILTLSSIITHSGKTNDNGHYTCFVRCPHNKVQCQGVSENNDFWMSYNDLNDAESIVYKDLDVLIQEGVSGSNSDVLRRGIVYIYA